jgi:NAD(P)-dependent dehydrogenase (short-subunit alcohol dehydrogenase family)
MVVTGATNGIGLITAQVLAATGARVVLVGRSEQRLAQAVAHIQSISADAQLDTVCADLSVQHDVYAVANHIKTSYERIDVLINNAGAYYATRQLSADGIEMTWALNHMAPFILTNALLDLFRQSAPARIITVSSMAHQSATINFDDIQGERRYSGLERICSVETGETFLFTYELADRLQQTDITVNCLHPGFVATGFAHNNHGFMANVMALLQRFFAITPEKGAETSVFLATSPSVNAVTGRYFVDSMAVASSKVSYDVTSRRRLWELSQKLVRS